MINTVKKAIDYFLWKSKLLVNFNRIVWDVKHRDKNFTVKLLGEDYCFENLPLSFDDEILNKHHREQNQKWNIQKNQIIHLKGNIYVEPERGLVVYGLNSIAGFSRIHAYAYPNILAFQFAKFFKTVETLETAIYFDGYLGSKYYHFFHDVLNSYWSLIQIRDYQNLPVLIGEETLSKPYVQFVLENTELKNLKWKIIKKNQWLRINHLIKPVASDLAWRKTARMWPLYTQKVPLKKIFLTRPKRDGRYIRNIEDIIPLLNEYNIEVVDTSSLTPKEQIQMFQETYLLIGIHGAGLTNILFSDHKHIRVLEILPHKKLFPHYYWLSGILGVRYDAWIAGELDWKQSFKVDVDSLRRCIQQLLS